MSEREMFEAALDLPPENRAAYLDGICGGDAALRQRLEALLYQHDQAGSFLEKPAVPVAATFADPISERPGTIVGPYKLLEQIGEGGFGVVFMAEQTEPVRRKVALKVLKPGMDTRQVIARFEAERQALAIMDHPNIAKVFDGGATPSGRPYFVMELVKGVPITAFCDQQHLTPRRRLELFVPVCQAVQHAHQKGIIHRDLKPSNILVVMHDTTPVPKVIDFGVAKALGQELTDKTLFTGFAQMIGTPLYMSPEQAGQSGLDIDTRSDIYSLGVLLYELLTGSTPFAKERFKQAAYDEIRRIIREEEPPRPSTRLSDSKNSLPSISAQRQTEPVKLTKLVRGELDWIVMKALEKDRNRRYESPSALAQDIERYLHDQLVLACPPSAMYRFRKLLRRNKAAFVMGSVVALALVAFAVAGIFAYRHQVAEQQRLAEQKAHEERLLGVQRGNALEQALMAAMSGDLDGAEKLIGEAELLGASAGQVRMLRGQVAFHRGDMETAIQHLEQAAKLLPVGQPGAVAARAMLALAYAHQANGIRFEEICKELDELSPDTPEDFLFKGQIESMVHPGRGLQTLDEAIRRRNSIVARVARTEARSHRAIFTGAVRDAELAVEDARVAKAMLPGNALVFARSVYAHLVAASIFESKGRPGDLERVLAEARSDVQELKRFPLSPLAANTRFEYFVYIGDEDAACQMGQGGTPIGLVSILYRRGEFAKALKAADRSPRILTMVDRAFVLAELGPDGPARARAAFQEVAVKVKPSTLTQMCPPAILLLLGQRKEAIQAVLHDRQSQKQSPRWWEGWHDKRLDFGCGLISADELLQAAGTCRPKSSQAHFSIGLHQLADGDREAARDHFRKCADTHLFTWFWDYMWARAFLARMEKDPAWPPWIPLKK